MSLFNLYVNLENKMVEFWSMNISPPCRAVLLTAKACEVDNTVNEIDLMKGKALLKSTSQFIGFTHYEWSGNKLEFLSAGQISFFLEKSAQRQR